MQDYRWLHYALLAAGCAASINILGKIGMQGLDADLSTAVRSVVQAVFVVTFAVVIGSWSKLSALSGRPVAITMIVLSGVAGGLSWIFAFRALKLADASQVAPIDKLSMPIGILLAVVILRERPTLVNWAGIILIAGGAYLATLPRPKLGQPPALPDVPHQPAESSKG
jgi:transporter family protein